MHITVHNKLASFYLILAPSFCYDVIYYDTLLPNLL